MPGTRRNRKLARWGRETAARERPRDEVPAQSALRVELPAHDVPAGQRPVDADAAALAVTLVELRRRLRRARWIPWRRRTRPQLESKIAELSRQRQHMRGRSPGSARRL
jgi:hypothetical protein